MIAPSVIRRIYTSNILLVIMLGIAGVAIYILNDQMSSTSDRYNEHLNQDINAIDTIKIARYAESHMSLVQNIESRFKTAKDTVMIIEELERLARASNVSISITQADTGTTESGKQYLAITGDVLGSWDNSYRFIKNMDTFTYGHQMNKMVMAQQAPVGTSTERWKTTIELQVPYLPK